MSVHMSNIPTIINYAVAFVSVYIQVFLLLVFLEKRKELVLRREDEVVDLPYYPTVTITVPCYNEEKTVIRTVESLLQLDYPKDKIKICIVDDGSKDGTWDVVQQYKDNPQVQLYRKENGGKHTAMNYAIEKSDAEFIGGLDADSFVHPQALRRIIKTFFDDKEIMAVAPSILVYQPKNIIQKAQKVEYDMSVFTKKMLGFLNAIHVTPGPFSIFRREVFETIGPYRKAHNTEDQEIALRMHTAGYRIDHCPDAFVFTTSPNTIPKLYRQRLRWIYGFIKNAIDYRRLVFSKKHGTVGTFTIPSGFASIVSVVIVCGLIVYNAAQFIYAKIIQYQTIGFHSSFKGIHFDWFFFNTGAIVFITILLYVFVITALVMGRRMTEGRYRISLDILYFVIIYTLVAPIWLLKAVINAIRSKESSWTLERKVDNEQHI